ncbi:MAG: UDP-N-acetylglucosamine 2-epimerase [Ruminococcus sp.]|jgi:UDP-N-acetylglucosamine 2-epimerase (hydrolysing)|nr:UDP-N-acetylglucosamine 2-epimerase [Ruminococcus sp.]
MYRLVFLTGTRADYGKLKSIMQLCEKDSSFEIYVYVTGMHLCSEYGQTADEIKKDGYNNIIINEDYKQTEKMDENTALTMLAFSKFVREIKPDLIVVHGDRTEPLAGAAVGVLNNIKVAHIEGGEVTGTADEFMRHAVTKLSSYHFVANDEAKFRVLQLGEKEENVFVIGSPDIDIMLSDSLPKLIDVKEKYSVNFDKYSVCIYHPVTTDNDTAKKAENLAEALKKSEKNYVIIKSNNDFNNEIIIEKFDRLRGNKNFVFYDSLPFEEFLTLLKNAEFIIGNSSAGVREACVYGVPAIDLGTRQNKRYNTQIMRNIIHTDENTDEILTAISKANEHRFFSRYFGNGNSATLFCAAIKNRLAKEESVQKVFVDLEVTSKSIENYINEVCY